MRIVLRIQLLALLLLIGQALVAQPIALDSSLQPSNIFIRLAPAIFTVNSVPSTIDFLFIDESFNLPDTVRSSFSTNRMWTYGLGSEVSYLMKKDFTATWSNYFGLGGRGNFFTYIGQMGLGYERSILDKLYVQPSFSMAYLHSFYHIGAFESQLKGFFTVNGRNLYDDMTVRIQSRAFAISPSLTIDYPIPKSKFFALFLKMTAFYTFGRASYLSFRGVTDELTSEGDAITAFESLSFGDVERFTVNGRQLFSRQDPYFFYQLNRFLIQIGVTLRLPR